MAESLRDSGATPGKYRLTSLERAIDNFIVMYIGMGKVLQKVPRYEVAAMAQRALQEFSYDIINSEKTTEVSLNAARTIQLTPDFVNIIGITVTGRDGVQREVYPSLTSKSTRAAIQDEDYDYIYDNDGDIVYANKSESIDRFQNPGDSSNSAIDRYTGYLDDDDYSYYYQTYLGRRYGLEPQYFDNNPKYVIDYETGIVYFDQNVNQDDIITLRYISDGLADGNDLSNVYIPKMAEDALYARMLYDLCKIRPSAAQLVPLYKKEAMAKTRNAKIRLSNFRQNLRAQIFRGQSKWIKH